MIARCR